MTVTLKVRIYDAAAAASTVCPFDCSGRGSCVPAAQSQSPFGGLGQFACNCNDGEQCAVVASLVPLAAVCL